MTAGGELKILPGYYWRYRNRVKNFGDLVGPVVLRYLGYRYEPRDITMSVMPQRPLLAVGSILSAECQLGYHGQQEIDIWGCGIRHVVDDPGLFRHCRFLAVRGELSRLVLKLGDDVAIGDTGLLLPGFYSPQHCAAHADQILLVPHFLRDVLYADRIRPEQFGCTRVLSSRIVLTQQEQEWLGYQAPEYQQVLDRFDNEPLLNRDVSGFFALIDALVSSRFVLTGSLHFAILAQAWGIPWAPLNDGFIDIPAKWLDFGSSLGVRMAFFSSAREGYAWWARHVAGCSSPDTGTLLKAFLDSR